MTGTFTVDDALDLAQVTAPEWNDDGSRVGFLRFSDGTQEFVSAAIGGPTADRHPGIGPEDGDVTGFDWRPNHPDETAIVADGTVELVDVDADTRTPLLSDVADHGTVAWHPDGDVLAVHRDDRLHLHDRTTGSTRTLCPDGPDVASLFGPTPIEWSPDGRYVATYSRTDDVLGVAVYEVSDDAEPVGEVGWHRSPDRREGTTVGAFDWVAPGHLVYAKEDVERTKREYRSVRIESDDDPVTLLEERDDRSLARDEPVGSGDGRFAVLSGRTGYHHVSVVDVDQRRAAIGDGSVPAADPGFDGPGVVQVTDGQFEARGDAMDTPAWGPDGDQIAYVTNEHDLGERRLHVATIGTSEDGPTVESVDSIDTSGNACYPAWSEDGRLACIRAGRTTPADVHVSDREHTALERLSQVYPESERLSWFPDPEPVSFEGTGEQTVSGYLYAPPDAKPGDDRPAVIWAHGGPVRQMRRGFHHMRSYAQFHAFNHVLVSRGYVVLELNYRGGIGYGREFEHGIHGAMGVDDVDDCVRAADFLREHDLVGDRVGLWGLSYGGFLAAAIAAEDAVDCAVNFAGVWNWADWVRYATDRHWGAASGFAARFGGHPDEDDPEIHERYELGSPSSSAEAIDTPMYALHGTADPNVPFDQMDQLVDDLVAVGADFEMAYYPDEDHMFRDPNVWRDALGRVLPFLDGHLRD